MLEFIRWFVIIWSSEFYFIGNFFFRL